MRFDIWETWREAINRMTLKTFKHSANCLGIDSNFVFLLRNNFKIRLLSLCQTLKIVELFRSCHFRSALPDASKCFHLQIILICLESEL